MGILKKLVLLFCSLAFHSPSSAQLFLSPLIKGGNISEAQNLSEVKNLIPNDTVKSFSGFITVNEAFNTNLFFWYFPAVNNPETAPVILFNDGGPGASLMNSLLAYNGPYRYDPVTKAFEHRNNFSWTSDIHMIFVDNPAGVGFSFTEDEAGYPTSGQAAAPDMYEFLLQFFEMFPNLQQNDFYNSGASFGGIYSTSLAHLIHERNLNSTNPPKIQIPLKGLILDSPWLYPLEQVDYTTVLYGFGLIDEPTKLEMEKKQEAVRELIQSGNLVEAVKVGMELTSVDIPKATGYFPLFNMVNGIDGSPLLLNYTEFIEQESTRTALHVGNQPFFAMGTEAASRIRPNFMSSVKEYLEVLIESGKYKIIAFGGNWDISTNHIGVSKVMEGLNWNGSDGYENARREIWTSENGAVLGYIKSFGNLSHVIIRNASHGSGIDQPESVWKLVNAFVSNENLISTLRRQKTRTATETTQPSLDVTATQSDDNTESSTREL